jgi:hypothetical protein
MGWLILLWESGNRCELTRDRNEPPFSVTYRGSLAFSWYLIHVSTRFYIWSLGIPVSRSPSGEWKSHVRILRRDCSFRRA